MHYYVAWMLLLVLCLILCLHLRLNWTPATKQAIKREEVRGKAYRPSGTS
jgi:hypothetical protein